jgi:hypothetical protein
VVTELMRILCFFTKEKGSFFVNSGDCILFFGFSVIASDELDIFIINYHFRDI